MAIAKPDDVLICDYCGRPIEVGDEYCDVCGCHLDCCQGHGDPDTDEDDE